ncbi:uncharacterized protein LOC113873407 [Abrus precatorius]|uniref:Uncharacterized protein LOC113873407 n=1 Tax=Abrus precatorius TaxID=3816 RepID=A0A8B8MHF3_ABRPR|nr:uncharacterized protein LOC113873407 [Abrus precatorius]
MLDFGEELTLDSFKIPWLIWIQLLILLLLLALFFFSSIIALDPSHDTVPSSASSTQHDFHSQSLPNTNHSTAVVNRLHNTRGAENVSVKGEIVSIASTGIVSEEIAEREGSSLYFLHPCYYLKLARVAFLKCLGLDSSSEFDNPSSQKHRKTKES